MLQIIQQATILIGTGIGAITDAKTGYIYDWITYPMIIIGIITTLLQQQWNNLILAVLILTILYATYKLGKIGGGDVKLYTAIALLNPQNNPNFLMTAIFFAAMSAMIYYPTYYTIKYARRGIKLEENKEGIKRALLLGAIIIIYFGGLVGYGYINPTNAATLLVPMLFGLVFIGLQKGITKNFFEKKILLKELEEDEVLAEGKNSEKIMRILKGKKLIGEKERKLLQKNGVKSIYVLRGLPPFGPFILIGVSAAILSPGFIMFLFN
jgi:hypothetical protein